MNTYLNRGNWWNHLQQNTEENVRENKGGFGNPILIEDWQKKQVEFIRVETDNFNKPKESPFRKNHSSNINLMRKSYYNQIDKEVVQFNFNNQIQII